MPAAARSCEGSLCSCDAGQRDGAAVLARGAGQRVDQGRLAGAVAPQQRQGLAGRQRQRHAVQDHGLAIAGAQVLDLQQLSHARPSPVPEVHRLDLRVARDLLRRAFGQHGAVDQHRHARGEAEHQVHVVFDQQHRDVGRQVAHGAQQFLALAGRHAGDRLVEQQHARLAGQRDGDLQQPALAVGQHAGGLVLHAGRGGTARAAGRSARPPRGCAPSGCHQLAPRPRCCDTVSASVSSGVRLSNSWLIWKVRTMPRRTRWCGAQVRDVPAFQRDAPLAWARARR